MKKNTDILIIGGGPAGVVSAITSRKNYPSKKVMLIRKEKKAIVPCGIPYVFDRLKSVDENIMSDQPLLDNEVDLIIEEVEEIKADERFILLKNGDEIVYEKLILALGSKADIIPIPGADKKGIWLVKKDYDYLKALRESVLKSKKVAIVGGGFIGVEFAEELSRIKELEVSIIEKADHCLNTNFDEEFSQKVEERLKKSGVKIITGKTIKMIGGDEKVEYLEFEDQEKMPVDLIIFSIGAKPNIELAKKSGIEISKEGSIITDEYLRTNLSDIFAVGDCSQSKDFIMDKNISIMLASVAANEGRIAASNLYHLELLKENKGTLGVFSTSICGLTLGVAGLTESRAKEQKIDYITGESEVVNRHPGVLPGAEKIKTKLIFSKSCENLLLGGEVMGPESAGEILNIIALAIQKKASVFDFNTWQIATHPLLTPPPTAYHLIAAAQSALMKINKVKTVE